MNAPTDLPLDQISEQPFNLIEFDAISKCLILSAVEADRDDQKR